MSTIVSIQDLSCLGKCSLTVTLPVVSAMGVGCAVLPTAVLSTHTAFPHPHIADLSEHILPILRHWHQVGASFQGILTGYLANPGQVDLALACIDGLGKCQTVCDPAMGDHGRLYSGLDQTMVDAMGRLCRRADLILPNVTEGALLAGLPYPPQADEACCRRITQALHRRGMDHVLLTGMVSAPGKTGFFWSQAGEQPFAYSTDALPRSCHGTGDLFAAVVMGGLIRGMDVPTAGILAAEFVKRCIALTPADSRFGSAFEPELGWLAAETHRLSPRA